MPIRLAATRSACSVAHDRARRDAKCLSVRGGGGGSPMRTLMEIVPTYCERRLSMFSRTEFSPFMECALRHALCHLNGDNDRPIGPTTNLGQLRARLSRPLAEHGVEPTQVIDDLVRDAEGGIIGCTSGRFFGWVIGGTLPTALAADW